MDATGGPPGTGRPTSSVRSRQARAFEGDLAEARRATRLEERRSLRREAVDERMRERREARQAAPPEHESPRRDPSPAGDRTEPSVKAEAPGGEVEAGENAEPNEPQAKRAPRTPRATAAGPAQHPAQPPPAGAGAAVQEASVRRPVGAAMEAGPAGPFSPPALLQPANPQVQEPGRLQPLGSTAAGAGAVDAPHAETPAANRPAAGRGAEERQQAVAEPKSVEGGRTSSAPPAAGAESARVEAAEARPAPAPAHEVPRAHAQDQAAEILRQVRMQITPELRQATIQLEPAALGRLAIRLEVRRGRVRAELAVERPETLSALERHVPELRAALSSAGFDQAELSLSLAHDGGARSQGSPRRAQPGPAAPTALPAPALQRAVARRIAGAGGIDTYA